MAGPIASLFVSLGLDAREFTTGIDQSKKAVAGFTQDAGSRFSQFGANVKQGFGLAFGFATQRLITDAASAVTGFVTDSIAAYKQQEVATAKLNTALDGNVANWRLQKGAIDDAIASGVAMGFQDDQVSVAPLEGKHLRLR